MAAMKPRTGDGPMGVTKEGRGIVMRVPLEGGGRLVVELNAETGAWSPRERRWSPYTSNRADRARMRSLCQFHGARRAGVPREGSRTPHPPIGDNGHRIRRVGVSCPVRLWSEQQEEVRGWRQ